MAIAIVAIALAALLAEAQAREDRAKDAGQSHAARWAEVVRDLRSGYHDKAAAFARSKAKRRAVCATRRASKTYTIAHETLARALERRFRCIYAHATRAEALRLIWRGDNRDGWRDLVDDCKLRIAHTRKEFDANRDLDCLINETTLSIEFRNGSQLAVFCADRPEDADKLRGGEKDVVVVDEAQQFPSLLYFVEEVVEKMLAKPFGQEAGEVWLAGTPSRNLAGLFYEITKEPEQGDRRIGWEVHNFDVTDNPYYGTTPEERWAATAGAELLLKGWTIETAPPQFHREWRRRWVTTDALFVYAVHAAPPYEFAPVRVDEATGRYDHAAAVADLPMHTVDARGVREPIDWYFTMGCDFGYSPDPFAWVLWAWSPHVEEVYEMGAWKRALLKPDEMRDHLVGVYGQVKSALVSIRGDAGGAMASGTIAAWEEVVKLPIEPADKHDKQTWQELYNGELHARRLRYRVASPLLLEQRHLQWRMTRPSETREPQRIEWAGRVIETNSGKVKHGNHLCDAALYAWRDIAGRQTTFTAPPKTSEERAAAFLAEVDRQMAQRFDEDQESQ